VQLPLLGDSGPLPGLRVVGLALRQHRPQLPGVLVGDGDECLVVADPPVERDDPLLQTGQLFGRLPPLFSECRGQYAAGALHEQGSQVVVATPGDAPEPGLAAAD